MNTAAESNAARLCDGLIEAGWLGALILLPLLFNPYSETRYEPDKVVMLRSITALAVGAGAVGAILRWRARAGAASQWLLGWEARAGAPSRWLLVWRARPSSVLRAHDNPPFVGAALLMGLACVAGSVVSVAPRVSWLGSYTRQQGTLTFFCYLALFFLVLTRLRRIEQWRRMAFAVLVTSVPISAHAIAEQLRLDPLGMSALSARSTGTLGNPIFLAAYLIFAIFVSLEGILSQWTPTRDPGALAVRAAPGRAARMRTATCASVLALQLAGFFSAQSRGPTTGLLAGLFVLALVGLILRKREGIAAADAAAELVAVRPRGALLRHSRRWGWAVPLVIAAVLVSILAAAAVPDSPWVAVRQVPYLGRLSSVFDLESGSTRVRMLIWRGVADLFADPAARLPPPAVDGLLYLRAPFGYGPETLMLVFGRYYPPELGPLQGWQSLPDRAHSETFDALASAGALGAVAVLTLFAVAFFRSLVWLLAIGRARERRRLLAALLAGSAAGVIAPWALTSSLQLVAVGAPLGLLAGLTSWTIREGLRDGVQSRPQELPAVLILVLFGALVAHWIEIASGIAIVSTRAYFWLLLGVLAVAGSGRLEGPECAKKSAELRRRGGWAGQVVVWGLLCGTAMTTLVFDLFIYSPGGDTLGAVITDSLLGRADGPPGALWLLLLTWGVGSLLLFVETPGLSVGGRGERPAVRGFAVFAVASLLPPAAFALVHAGRLAGAARLTAEGRGLGLAMHLASFFSVYHTTAIALLLATGVALGKTTGRRLEPRAAGLAATLGSAVTIAVALAIVSLASIPGLRGVRADALVHQGKAYATARRFELATLLYTRAVELRPREDSYLFSRGNAYFEWARRTTTGAERDQRFDSAFASITRAVELNPLDASHHANVGRVLMSWGATVVDPERRRRTWFEADAYFGQAQQLHPTSADLATERAQLRQLLSAELSGRAGRRLPRSGAPQLARGAEARLPLPAPELWRR